MAFPLSCSTMITHRPGNGDGSPDRARLVVRAFTPSEQSAAEGRRIAGITAERANPGDPVGPYLFLAGVAAITVFTAAQRPIESFADFSIVAAGLVAWGIQMK
jgi:hypothetical protein